MIKKTLFVLVLVFCSSSPAIASQVVRCAFLGEYTKNLDDSDEYYTFEYLVLGTMKINGSYIECNGYLNSVQEVSLLKDRVPKGGSFKIGDRFFIEYYHMFDKGDVHVNSFRYIGHHDENH